VLAACGGSGAPTSPGGASLSLAIVGGADQTGPVGTELPAAIVVRVVDTKTQAPASGQLVNFVVVEGGGSVFAGSAQTNAQGEARERWTLGTKLGAQALEARAVDQTTGEAITFARITGTATAGPITQLFPNPRGALALLNTDFDLHAAIDSAFDSFGNRVTGYPLAVTPSKSGAFTLSGTTLRATSEADILLTLASGSATINTTVRARRDLAPLVGTDGNYDCVGLGVGVGPWGPIADTLAQRWGQRDWKLVSWSATFVIDSVQRPSAYYDWLLWMTESGTGVWSTTAGSPTVQDTLHVVDRQPFWASDQRPDSLWLGQFPDSWARSDVPLVVLTRPNHYEGGGLCAAVGGYFAQSKSWVGRPGATVFGAP
jgi:hypothetical protein